MSAHAWCRQLARAASGGPDCPVDEHHLAGGPGAVTAVAHRLDLPRWYVAPSSPSEGRTELAEYGGSHLGGPEEQCRARKRRGFYDRVVRCALIHLRPSFYFTLHASSARMTAPFTASCSGCARSRGRRRR
jgi:hypothetical protein